MGLFAQKCNSVLSARRQLTAWVAVVALIVQIFVPLGQALAVDGDQGIEYQVICTANGFKQIPIDQNGAPIEIEDGVQCAFCLVHSTPALMSPLDSDLVTVFEETDHHTFALLIQHGPANIWRGAPRPSRGPPLSV